MVGVNVKVECMKIGLLVDYIYVVVCDMVDFQVQYVDLVCMDGCQYWFGCQLFDDVGQQMGFGYVGVQQVDVVGCYQCCG